MSKDLHIQFSRLGTVVVNGKTYSGNQVQFSNGQVIVDGKAEGDPHTSGVLEVVVHGDVEHLETVSGAVSVQGAVSGGIQTVSGSVSAGGVYGNVRTVSGKVQCGSVHGSVQTSSGNIHSGN